MAKKVEHHKNELLENPEALAHTLEGAENWAERHSKLFFGIIAVAALGVAGYFGFTYYKDKQNVEAQNQMFQASCRPQPYPTLNPPETPGGATPERRGRRGQRAKSIFVISYRRCS